MCVYVVFSRQFSRQRDDKRGDDEDEDVDGLFSLLCLFACHSMVPTNSEKKTIVWGTCSAVTGWDGPRLGYNALTAARGLLSNAHRALGHIQICNLPAKPDIGRIMILLCLKLQFHGAVSKESLLFIYFLGQILFWRSPELVFQLLGRRSHTITRQDWERNLGDLAPPRGGGAVLNRTMCWFITTTLYCSKLLIELV